MSFKVVQNQASTSAHATYLWFTAIFGMLGSLIFATASNQKRHGQSRPTPCLGRSVTAGFSRGSFTLSKPQDLSPGRAENIWGQEAL